MRKDLRSRITDERPGVARPASPQARRESNVGEPTVLARTLQCNKTKAWGEHCGAYSGQTLPAALPTRTCPLRNGGN